MVARPRHCLPLLLALVVSCAGADAPSSGASVHLDPRLADGSSSAAALAAPAVLVRSFEVTSMEAAEADLAPWRGRNLRLGEGGEGGGVVFRAAAYDLARGIEHAFLEYGEEIDTSSFNRVELELYTYNAGAATLFWGDGTSGTGGRADANTVAGAWQTVSLSMVGDASWSGEVRGLRLLPVLSGPQAFELREIRLLREDFEPGAQPSLAHGGRAGDAGLLGPVGDQRRSWPSDAGVELFDNCRVPLGGRLAVSANLAGGVQRAGRSAHFAVDLREQDEGWTEVVHEVLAYDEQGTDFAWRELGADLSPWSGREVELRFRSWFGDAPPAEVALSRGEFLWGAPMVFAPRVEDARPNLILVTLDTLRADAVGVYGGTSDTPFIDQLAGESLWFEDSWTACNSTLPSHTSMLTGLPVPTHGVLDNVSTLAPDVRTLAQALRERGYTTAAAVSVEHLQPEWSGLGRGFDRYLAVQPGASVDGARTLAPVIGWLDELSGEGARPLFLWVHLFDPHTPYGPPAGFLREYEQDLVARGGSVPARSAATPDIGRTSATAPGGFLEGVTSEAYARHLYAAGVAYTDYLLGQFSRALDQRGLGASSALLVTSDHGESLGEHDVWYGHQRLHPEVTRVPLVLRLPTAPEISLGTGRETRQLRGRVETRASTLDIAATFLSLAGGAALAPRGEDLLELAAREPGEDRRVWFVHASGEQAGCRDDSAHYWHNLLEFEQLGPERREPAGLDSLYLLAGDPGAKRDIALEQPDLCGRYRERLEAWLARSAGGRSLSAEIDPAQAERLRALGYTGGE